MKRKKNRFNLNIYSHVFYFSYITKSELRSIRLLSSTSSCLLLRCRWILIIYSSTLNGRLNSTIRTLAVATTIAWRCSSCCCSGSGGSSSISSRRGSRSCCCCCCFCNGSCGSTSSRRCWHSNWLLRLLWLNLLLRYRLLV